MSILALQNQQNLALSAYIDSVKPLAQGLAWGKVMLFGEYAVLNGGPALLTATPQQAKAYYLDLSHLTQILQIDSSLKLGIEESGVSPSQIEYVICAFNWGSSILYKNKQGDLKCLGESFAFIERCLHEAGAPKGIYLIDTQEFGLSIHGQWQKMGIGSSGASSAALCSLLSQLPASLLKHTQEKPYERFLFAQAQHKAVQGGLGSGADVACSTFGGLIEFKLHDSKQTVINPLSTVLPRTWGLWKGGSFSTAQSLSQLKLWKQEHPKSYQKHISNLTQVSQQALNFLQNPSRSSDSQKRWCELIQSGAQAMRLFSHDIALPLWTNTHEQWSQLIKDFDGVIKSTGAGGDDLTLFAAHDLHAEQRCLELIKAHCAKNNEPLFIFPLSPLIQDQESLVLQAP